jgi:Type II CAAX prenyl endopeptidase Rce1-like
LLLRTQFFNFLKNPEDTVVSSEPIETKLNAIFRIYSVDFVVCVLGLLICVYTTNIIGYEGGHRGIEMFSGNSSSWEIFLAACVVAPFVEESAFRLILKPSKFNYAFGFSMFLMIWIIPFVIVQIFQRYLLVGILTTLLYLLFLYYEDSYLKLNNFIQGNYKVIFYLIIVLFGLRHIWNYDVSATWYVAPLLVIPQFSAGIALGYVRVKYGIFYSMLLHGFSNLIPSVPVGIAKELAVNIKQLTVKDGVLITNISDHDQILIFAAFAFILLVLLVTFYNTLVFSIENES